MRGEQEGRALGYSTGEEGEGVWGQGAARGSCAEQALGLRGRDPSAGVGTGGFIPGQP